MVRPALPVTRAGGVCGPARAAPCAWLWVCAFSRPCGWTHQDVQTWGSEGAWALEWAALSLHPSWEALDK